MIPQKGFDYGLKTQNSFKGLVKQANAAVTVPEPNGVMGTFCNLLDILKIIMILVLVIIGIAAFISLIIILLSIGSVANTIKISAEQNRKFFGVMKAIGMRNKSLRSILTGQIVIMTLLGVALASVGAFLIIGVAEAVLGSLLGSLFVDAVVICEISPFIPVAVALVLIGFVLLFTKTSLRAFSRMDVITVINDVN
jgi:putative ABC transport system permease protein